MAETKKVKMLVTRGNPTGGPFIRAGATVDLPTYWADRFIEDGTAELISEEKVPPAKPKGKKNAK